LVVSGASSARGQATSNPIVTAISPASVTQGNSGFSITVTGSNFVPGSSVKVDDYPVPTTFISTAQLVGLVPASFLTTPSQLPISVTTPTDLGSNQVFLTVGPGPTIVAATPQDVVAGSPGFTLTVVGSHFVPGCTVQVAGVALITSYIRPNQ
jgi:hypothetical protein